MVGTEAHMDANMLMKLLKKRGSKGGLFAFPAQSNITGVQHSLGVVK